MAKTPSLMTVAEASKMLGVTKGNIYYLARTGKLEIYPPEPARVHVARIKELAKDRGIELQGEEIQNA